MENYYVLLGISLNETDQNVISQAFKKQIKLYHPDIYKDGILNKIAERITKSINNARDTLTNSQKRDKYNLDLLKDKAKEKELEELFEQTEKAKNRYDHMLNDLERQKKYLIEKERNLNNNYEQKEQDIKRRKNEAEKMCNEAKNKTKKAAEHEQNTIHLQQEVQKLKQEAENYIEKMKQKEKEAEKSLQIANTIRQNLLRREQVVETKEKNYIKKEQELNQIMEEAERIKTIFENKMKEAEEEKIKAKELRKNYAKKILEVSNLMDEKFQDTNFGNEN